MERQPRRLGRISGAFATALLLAACEGNSPATPTPVRTPEVTPSPIPTLVTPTPEATPSATPSLIVTPTPEVTPSPVITPTPEITPSPTPEATPVTMGGIVDSVVAEAEQNGGYANVSAGDTQQSYEDAYTADPEAAAATSHSGETYLQIAGRQWKICKTGNDPDSGGDPEFNRYNGCRSLIQNLWTAYGINNTTNFLPAIEDAINFSENHLVQPYNQQLLEDLRSLQ